MILCLSLAYNAVLHFIIKYERPIIQEFIVLCDGAPAPSH